MHRQFTEFEKIGGGLGVLAVALAALWFGPYVLAAGFVGVLYALNGLSDLLHVGPWTIVIILAALFYGGIFLTIVIWGRHIKRHRPAPDSTTPGSN